MSHERKTSLEREIFLAAARLTDPAEIKTFLDEVCHDAPDVRARVEELLSVNGSDEAGENPLDRYLNIFETPDDPSGTTELPRKAGRGSRRWRKTEEHDFAGRYQLLDKIGNGGMGTVYRACQLEPVCRHVAVKIINPGMNSQGVLSRFHSERQTLAMMDHPNIARIFDGGETTGGQPYIAMELVRGISIIKYCKEHELTLPQRLDLFLDVCSAVQHAHQKGIIHRDLKPSNILVETHEDGDIPKIIDFGISRPSEGRQPDETAITGFYEVLGTPMYMSPEQAAFNAIDIDTRSDVYSLGVLLYEMISNQPPYAPERIKQADFTELFQIIREETPPRPSRVAGDGSTTQDARNQHPPNRPNQLIRRVESELDWVVMKAMEKERNRRYQTARELAEDVQRFLAHEPITARPPSLVYRLQKTARRNVAMVAGFTVAVMALLVGTTIAVWQAREANSARELAETRSELIEQANVRLSEQVEVAEKARATVGELLYATEIQLASQALNAGDIPRTTMLLDRQKERHGDALQQRFEWNYLNRMTARNPDWTFNALGEVRRVRMSPNRRWFAIAARDSILRVIDVNTGKTVCQSLTWSMLNSAAWSPDGQQIACACSNGTVKLFSFADPSSNASQSAELRLLDTIETQDTSHLETIIDTQGEANDALFTPDGEFLLTAGDDGRVGVWNRKTQSLATTLTGHLRAVEQMDVSSDGSILATASDDRFLKLWNLSSGKSIGADVKFPGRVVATAFSSDGTLVAAGCITGQVAIVDIPSGEVSRTEVLDGVESLMFLSSPLRLVAGDRGGTIHLWDLTVHSSDRFPKQPRFQWSAHEGCIRTLTAGRRQDCIVSGGRDGRVLSWSASGVQSYRQINDVHDAAFDRHGQLLTAGPQMLVVDPDLGRIRSRQPLSTNGWKLIRAARNSPEVVLADNERVKVWNSDSQTNVAEWKLSFRPRCIAISDDGEYIAWADQRSDTAEIRRVSSGEKIRSLPALSCWSMSFSPDGQTLAVGHLDSVALFDVQKDSVPRHLKGHRSTLTAVCFSPDGKHIATGSHDRHVRIWDAHTGDALLSVPGHTSNVSSVEWCDTGTRIVSADKTGHVRIWNGTGLKPLIDLQVSGKEAVRRAALSPDGRSLFAVTDQGRLEIFDSVRPAHQHISSAPKPQNNPSLAADLIGLGDLPGGKHCSLANGISSDGSLVVGHSFREGGFSPFVWSAESGMTLLGPPTSTGRNAQCNCVSADGSLFAGAGAVAGEKGYTARIWSSDGATTSLSTVWGNILAMSADSKTLVGTSKSRDGRQPFVIRQEQLTTLELPAGFKQGTAYDITADGNVILGVAFKVLDTTTKANSVSEKDWREATPVRWKNGSVAAISGFTSEWNWKPMGMSDDGSRIVGICWASGTDSTSPGARMFVWTNGDVQLLEPPAGYLAIRPRAISGDGTTIVGNFAQALDRRVSRAFLWRETLGFIDLNTIQLRNGDGQEWTLVDANAVNQNGNAIAGYGKNCLDDLEAWKINIEYSDTLMTENRP